MPQLLERDALPALACGLALLGSGGGGSTTLLEAIVRRWSPWPLEVHGVDELDPATPCVAVGFAGSTLLLTERIPAPDAFAPLLRAAERWTGERTLAACGIEHAGLNGLTPFMLAHELRCVDADLTGRALPGLDQLSFMVDGVPDLVVACSAGGDGVVLMDGARGPDVEAVVRSALVRSGGVSGVLVAGFTVGDLREHAIVGNLRRAHDLGVDFLAAADLRAFAVQHGGAHLGSGRLRHVAPGSPGSTLSSAELVDVDGAVVRLVAGSELLAVQRDGRTVAATPDIVVAVDSLSRRLLEVADLTPSQHVDVLTLPAPTFWRSSDARLAAVSPSAFGIDEVAA